MTMANSQITHIYLAVYTRMQPVFWVYSLCLNGKRKRCGVKSQYMHIQSQSSLWGRSTLHSINVSHVKCEAELDVCHLSLEVQHKISVDYSLWLSIGKTIHKKERCLRGINVTRYCWLLPASGYNTLCTQLVLLFFVYICSAQDCLVQA